MSVAIVTDTNSGISAIEAEAYGIYLVPMPVLIDGETFYEGKNLTEEAFYQALADNKDVSTSQPAPGELMDLWTEVLKKYDELVYIPMSSGLSGSCSSAKVFAEDYDGRVQVVDNHRISVTMRCSVLKAKELADLRINAETIREVLEEQAYDASIFLAVNTLDYLKKGGRISSAAALIGSVLNIKPILTIMGEKIDPFTVVRGSMKRAEKKMLESIKKDLETRFPTVDQSRWKVGGAGAGLSDEEKEEWINLLKEEFPNSEVFYSPLSASIGTHTGPGAVGIGITIE